MKNYFGISRDHSGSMGHIRHAAAKDYNENIASIKDSAFYELSKPEKVQGHKDIAIRDKTTGARDLLGLPKYGDIRLAPLDHGNYNLFVQSTSVNRKLMNGTNLMIWKG